MESDSLFECEYVNWQLIDSIDIPCALCNVHVINFISIHWHREQTFLLAFYWISRTQFPAYVIRPSILWLVECDKNAHSDPFRNSCQMNSRGTEKMQSTENASNSLSIRSNVLIDRRIFPFFPLFAPIGRCVALI